MPVKRPVQEELLVRHNYTVEMCFAVDSLLINFVERQISLHICFTGVIPYLPYSKQAKMNKRGSIPSKLVASLMCRAGVYIFLIL